MDRVLAAKYYKQEALKFNDVIKPVGSYYLGIYQLRLDGAEEAGELIGQINTIYQCEHGASDIDTWLYYPTSEKQGCNSSVSIPESPYIVVAFASAVKGREAEFPEW